MRKSLLTLAIALVGTLFASAQITDTIVSLTPSNRNAVIEEYTGVNCQYCPCGHKATNQAKEANPGRVIVINIHTGGFAAAYQTQFGSALLSETGSSNFPTVVVNRRKMAGSSVIAAPEYWQSPAYANTILGLSSPVNIAAEGTLDWATRTVNIRVQLYYTANQTVTSNALNVAILQDNVIGPQIVASGCSYPEMMVGDLYRHNHMLRHLITGQWGETISDIAAGTLIEKTYEYTIPEKLGTPAQAIDAYLEDLNFVAFVAENHKEILTGIEIPIEIINRPEIEARLVEVNENLVEDCTNKDAATFVVKHSGASEEANIESIKYSYTVAGVEHNGEWTGSIAMGATTTIEVPTFDIAINQDQTIAIKINEVNGNAVDGTEKSITIRKIVYSAAGYIYFKLVTDKYGNETTFKIYDENGNVVLNGGPYKAIDPNGSSIGTTVNEIDFMPEAAGCYLLEVLDEYGDGINAGYGNGYFEMYNAENQRLFRNNGKFGKRAVHLLDITEPYAIEDREMSDATIYPNPATDMVNISGVDNVLRVEIFNLQGQLVKAEANSSKISVKDLSNGMYLMKVTTENGTSMHKIVKE